MVHSKAPECLNQLFLFKKKQQKRLDKMPSNTFKDIAVSESNKIIPSDTIFLTQYSCNPEQKLSVVTKAQVKHTVCSWVNKKSLFSHKFTEKYFHLKAKQNNKSSLLWNPYLCLPYRSRPQSSCLYRQYICVNKKDTPNAAITNPTAIAGGVTHIFPYLPLLGASCAPLETWSRQKSFFSAKR